MKKRQLSKQMLLGILGISMQKTESRFMSFILYGFISKWLNDLNIKPETLKLVQERVGDTMGIHRPRQQTSYIELKWLSNFLLTGLTNGTT
jgi:hypothetical protein